MKIVIPGGSGLALAVALATLGCETHKDPPSRSAPSPIPAAITAPSLTPPARDGVDSTRPECARPEGDLFFFRAGTLIPGAEHQSADHFMRHWLSLALRKMREPSLGCASGPLESYRLLVLPSTTATFSVRVTLAAESARVSSVVLEGVGLELGKVAKQKERALEPAERLSLTQAVAAAAFWQMPTIDFSRDGLDGTQFVFEGRQGDRYHVVHRWLPEPGAYADLCRLATRLGGM